MWQGLTTVKAEFASARRQNAALKVVQRREAGQWQKQLGAERGAIEERDAELQAGRRALVLEKQNNQGLQVLDQTLREQVGAGKRQRAMSQSGEPEADTVPSGGSAAGGPLPARTRDDCGACDAGRRHRWDAQGPCAEQHRQQERRLSRGVD